MFIVSKDRDSIINMDHITNLHASDPYTIKAAIANGSGYKVGRYNGPVAEKVIEMIGLAIGKTEVYFLPSDESVQAKLNEERARYHSIDGKKQKGHGGS